VLPSTMPPQHRLYSQVLFALETRAHRYRSANTVNALQNGVRQEQLDRLNVAIDKAINQLPDRWDWSSDVSVTAALIHHRENLLATLEELAYSLRLCMETEFAAGKLNGVKLERLNDTEVELAELRVSLALLGPVHLTAANHFTSAVNEGAFFDVRSNSSSENNSADEEALLASVASLYSKLDATWRAYFQCPSVATLESYIAVAQELHAEGSPLIAPEADELLIPEAEAIASTEALLDELLAAALVAETIG
jgi:hypothetical protein